MAAVARQAIEIRELAENREFTACVELQKLVWGSSFEGVVPLPILKVAQRLGGVVVGAFDESDMLTGFVFGLTGWEEGRAVHWSDMLVVDPARQDFGIAGRLKAFQRELLLERQIERAYWTFDPLVARNAHRNLTRIGVRASEYLVDMYGATGEQIDDPELGTDRLLVVWDLTDESSREAPETEEAEGALPELVASDGGEPQLHAELLQSMPERLTIEIPDDLAEIQRRSLGEAAFWRSVTRAGFLGALERGYRVIGFRRADPERPPVYLLGR